MQQGLFDPDGMIVLLRVETERALAEGYPALRVTGEMSWAPRGLPCSERLIEYEAKLNEFFPGGNCQSGRAAKAITASWPPSAGTSAHYCHHTCYNRARCALANPRCSPPSSRHG